MKQAGPCIYCRHTGPPSDFSAEHVVQESIGGTFKLPDDFVCKTCNDEMGHTIDTAVSNYFPEHRLMFRAKTKSGKPLKLEGAIHGPQGQKIRVQIDSQGRVTPKIQQVEDITPDGRQVHRILGPLDDAERIAKQLSQTQQPDALCQLGGTLYGESFRGPLVAEFTTAKPFMIERGLMKCAFNLVVLRRGKDFVLEQLFDDVRNFVRHGDPIVCCSSVPQVNQLGSSPKPSHHIRISVESNALAARCDFFEEVEFTGVLASKAAAPFEEIDEHLPAVF